MVHKCGADNIFVVSKAKPKMEQRIRQWLKDRDFYASTGFSHDNVIFVVNYEDKAVVVQQLEISIFYDDQAKVIWSLAPLTIVEHIFWMHADAREIKLLPKKLRHKVVPTKEWSQTMKFFQKTPKVEAD